MCSHDNETTDNSKCINDTVNDEQFSIMCSNDNESTDNSKCIDDTVNDEQYSIMCSYVMTTRRQTTVSVLMTLSMTNSSVSCVVMSRQPDDRQQ